MTDVDWSNWKDSDAQKLLVQDLSNGTIPSDGSMDPKDVYLQRTEFTEFPYHGFASRLLSLRNSIQTKKDFAAADSALLVHDQLIHLRVMSNLQGKL